MISSGTSTPSIAGPPALARESLCFETGIGLRRAERKRAEYKAGRERLSPTDAVWFDGTRWTRVASLDVRDWTRIAVDTLEAPGWSIAVDLENKTS